MIIIMTENKIQCNGFNLGLSLKIVKLYCIYMGINKFHAIDINCPGHSFIFSFPSMVYTILFY